MAKDNKYTRKLTQDNFVTEKIDVIENNLLGTYDEDGNYFIAPQIVEELIELEKVRKKAFGNSIFCVGNLLGYGELVFELLFDAKTSGNNAAATLYLLEDVDKINGYVQNTIKTKLKDFNRQVDDFIQVTYNYFNITTEEDDDDEEDEGKERKLIDDLSSEDSFIIAKKQYSLLLEKLLEDKYLDAYGKYFTYRMSTLTKLDNEFARTIIASFNRQYKLIENAFLHEKNYKVLNELLDKCVEEVSGTSPQIEVQEKEFNEKVAPALESFTENMDKLSEKYGNKALNMLKKDDREKVTEILEEHGVQQEQSRESKPNVQQIVNDVKTSQVGVQSQESTPQVAQTPKQDDNASNYIKDMLDSKKQAKESLYSSIRENAYQQAVDTPIVGGHYSQATMNLQENKVVETEKSDDIEKRTTDNNVAVSSLQSRISRLQKFKDDSYSIEEDRPTTASETLESMFDILSKEKEKKSDQVQYKNIKSREDIDNIKSPAYAEMFRQAKMREYQDNEMDR